MGFENPFFFCIFVTTYLTSTGKTAEERLGKVKSELENLMNLHCQEYLKAHELYLSDGNAVNLKDSVDWYYKFVSYYSLWSMCLDPMNVIDARDLDLWKMKLKNLKK